jgi:glutaryl-CoA dehydrogenase
VLNGRKRWIGNASFANLTVVWARDEEGDVGAYVVERGTPGFQASVITGKVAKRASLQCNIVLTDVEVPEENRLPGAKGFDDAARVLTACRPNVAWGALGHAAACFEIARAHVATRKVFGKPLAETQLIQYRLAHMLANITAMELMCFRLAQLAESGEITPPMASLAKFHNASRARTVVADARDMLGGEGILLQNDVARHQTDVEAVITVEGTDTVQALIVGREITGVQAFS